MIIRMLHFRNAIISYVDHIPQAQANPLRCVSGSRLDARDFPSPFPKVVSLSMPCALATLIIAFRAGRWWCGGRRIISKLFILAGASFIGQAFLADISPWIVCWHSEQRCVDRASEFPATPSTPSNRLCRHFTNPGFVNHIGLIINHVGWMCCCDRNAEFRISFLLC